jgi:hypothetical protein
VNAGKEGILIMENINLSNAILYADSSRGVYIPQFFAESINRECVSGISEGHWHDITLDPYGFYSETVWDAWNHVLDSATITDPATGIEYGLYQDGDLWIVPLVDLSDSEEG